MNGRKIVGMLVLIGSLVGGIIVLSDDGPSIENPPSQGTTQSPRNGGTPSVGAIGDRTPFQISEECAGCHQDVWDEWTTSYHAKAWTDPMVRRLADGFRMTECIDCHAPQPIHVTGVDQRVAPRQHSRSDGVDCLSCHLLDDGVSVAAGRTVDTSAVAGACRPKETPSMRDSSSCVGCHNQHETVDEVLASNTGKTCLDCHMETVERSAKDGRSARKGHSHRFPGAHEVFMHKRATTFAAEVKGDEFLAFTTNSGGAHHIPTDARHRSYNVWITLLDESGNVLLEETQMADAEYRLYYRNQFRPSTQIRHAETKVARWPVPAGMHGKARIRLTYALNPEILQAGEMNEVHVVEVTY